MTHWIVTELFNALIYNLRKERRTLCIQEGRKELL